MTGLQLVLQVAVLATFISSGSVNAQLTGPCLLVPWLCERSGGVADIERCVCVGSGSSNAPSQCALPASFCETHGLTLDYGRCLCVTPRSNNAPDRR
jgi:hypothetical protein